MMNREHERYPWNRVWVRHACRDYPARVVRVTRKGRGKRAEVEFSTRGGREIRRIEDPTDKVIRLGPEWAAAALARRGLPWSSANEAARAAVGGDEVRIRRGDFESVALANTIDAIAGRFVVDRGDNPVPGRPLIPQLDFGPRRVRG